MATFSAQQLTAPGQLAGPWKCDTSFSSRLLLRISGTWVGTLRVLAQLEDGAQEIVSVTNKRTELSADGITANGLYSIDTSGFSYALVQAESITSGSAGVLATVVIG